MSETTSERPYTTTDAGIPATERRAFADRRPRRAHPAPGPYLVQKMAALQPRAGAREVSSTPKAAAPSAFSRPLRTSSDQSMPRSRSHAHTECSHGSRPSPGSRGYADTARDPRGFAIKFYTERGQLRPRRQQHAHLLRPRPAEVPDFIHSQKRRADNNLRDNNMQWDFWTLSPESAHMVTWLMGDRGLPKTLAQHERLRPATPTCGPMPGARGTGSSTTSRPTRASSTSPKPRPRRWPPRTPTTT